jgi:hypothetical protein
MHKMRKDKKPALIDDMARASGCTNEPRRTALAKS